MFGNKDIPVCVVGGGRHFGRMPKDWNAAYESEDTPWDKGEAAPPLREFLARFQLEGAVLVPGCGSGHDVRLLAEQGAEVLGLDIAPAAVKQAAELSNGGARYLAGDFLDLPQGLRGQFDWVFEHTCLCALDPELRQAYADAVVSALKPGAQFLAIFYREVSDYNGDGPPHPISAEEIDALFGVSFEVVERFVPKQSYPSRPYGSEEVVLFRRLIRE